MTLPPAGFIHICPEANNVFKKQLQRTDDAYWLRMYAGVAMQSFIEGHLALIRLGVDKNDKAILAAYNTISEAAVHQSKKLLAEIKKAEEKK